MPNGRKGALDRICSTSVPLVLGSRFDSARSTAETESYDCPNDQVPTICRLKGRSETAWAKLRQRVLLCAQPAPGVFDPQPFHHVDLQRISMW